MRERVVGVLETTGHEAVSDSPSASSKSPKSVRVRLVKGEDGVQLALPGREFRCRRQTSGRAQLNNKPFS